jgi:ABC-type transporter Mla MlaB component
VNDHTGFEDRAVEYAVTFEMSPPSWEPPINTTLTAAAAPVAAEPSDNPEVLVLQGALVGSSEPQVAKLNAFREGRNVIPLDMCAVDRIDFVCAGALFNSISRAESQRKTVQITGATPIVRALLLLIGISPRHFIRKAE